MTPNRRPAPSPQRRQRTAGEVRADLTAQLADAELLRAQMLTRSTRTEVLATVDRLRRIGADVRAVRS